MIAATGFCQVYSPPRQRFHKIRQSLRSIEAQRKQTLVGTCYSSLTRRPRRHCHTRRHRMVEVMTSTTLETQPIGLRKTKYFAETLPTSKKITWVGLSVSAMLFCRFPVVSQHVQSYLTAAARRSSTETTRTSKVVYRHCRRNFTIHRLR